ncbi:Peptidyl-prolyl cis-trans isomerase [Methanosarcina lacustris Z-7289]|uniref:Peptidyl-prolyl cis-trans isomerase n=1 Tax=Methanosarcina lacustris Z-7289 TaxID=1434111 RepID=A0A0E3S2H8_9EURY|nr:peptidylprolyl isomerase [Methanosarcina lacustris]AKB74331.1 Peptidyl-prolyl cis-trans isomerase [Methanosarcina lacustris Z-7289]
MAIQKGDFIKLNYTGRFENGKIFDTTDEELAKKEEIFNPRGLYGGDVVIVGAGHTIEGLDEDLEGKDAGYTGTVSIPPEKAFGPGNPDLVETVSITKFQDRNVHPGMPVELDDKKGVVSRVIGRRVTVDFNSPLAGKTVSYEYTIEQVLEADVEKIQGLLALYTGIRDTEIDITDNVAKINVPTGLTFNQRWLMAKNRVASELFKYTGIKEVQLIEKLTAEAEVSAPAEPEVEAEAETEVKEEPSESQE